MCAELLQDIHRQDSKKTKNLASPIISEDLYLHRQICIWPSSHNSDSHGSDSHSNKQMKFTIILSRNLYKQWAARGKKTEAGLQKQTF